MIHSLTDVSGKTVVSSQTTEQDLTIFVDLECYTDLLFQFLNPKTQVLFIADFSKLQYLRITYHDHLSLDVASPQEFVKIHFTNIATKWGLTYITTEE